MAGNFGPEGPREPGWDWFWDQFRRSRGVPMRPPVVPPVDDGEKLRRARIRKAALDVVQALVPGERGVEKGDYASVLLDLVELVDDLDLCATCRRNEWECLCAHQEEALLPGPDDGFGMDRVVLSALDQAGIDLPTFWNGRPAQCRRVRVLVGPGPIDGWWSAPLEGQVRDAVEVRFEGRVFYIDDDDGTGWAHVTVRQGDPADGRPVLPVRRVLGAREGGEGDGRPRAPEPDVYAALALRAGVPVERVRQFFEGATPEQVKRLLEPPGGRDPIPLHRKGAPPWPAREAPAQPARPTRAERIRAACRDLIDVYHEPRADASDAELVDEAARVLERERTSLGGG